MSNIIAIRRHVTRLRRAALLGLFVLSAAGCENRNIIVPPAFPPSGLPPVPSATRTSVRLEGRIFDEQTDQAVEGARITITWITACPWTCQRIGSG